MNHALFSPEALSHFKKFAVTAQNDRAARRTSHRSNPMGAFDVSTAALKRAIARDAAPGEVSMDPQTLNMILEVLRETFGDDAHSAVSEALDKAFPGCVNAAHPESPDTITSEDEADRDYPPANAGGMPGEMQGEDFSGAAQFAKMGHDMPKPFPGMPVPGGKMVAQDRLRADYFESYPATRRFGDVTHLPTSERKPNAIALDKALARHQTAMKEYEAMFKTARIGIM